MSRIRFISVTMFALFAIVPLVAQAPAGWKVRVDRSTSASDPDAAGSITFMAMGSGFHAINPQAGVFWNPAHVATGTYSLKGTFTQLRPSDHTNYFGLIFGGSGLEGAEQSYLYFMVAQDGTWLVKRRNGSSTVDISDRTRSDAVKTLDGNGRSTNELEVRVLGDTIEYLVNGTTVLTTPRTGPTSGTDGIYGFRVNHRLEVQVDDLGVS